MDIDKSNGCHYNNGRYMLYTVSITSQGQITIPSQIRKLLGFSKKSKAVVFVDQNRMILKPVEDVLDLVGSIKTSKKPLSGSELHDFVAINIGEK
jgi:AbrB family looped-hinge helix DNA binding protein